MVKLTHEEFIAKVQNPYSEIIGTYVDYNTKILCRCKICGENYYANPYDVKSGKKHNECAKKIVGKKLRLSHEEFKKRMCDISPNIEIVGKYKNRNTKIECRCSKHDILFLCSPGHLLSGETGCQECIKIKNHLSGLKTQEEFSKSIKADNVKIIGNYNGAKQKVKTKCLSCGHIWSPVASSLVSGYGCPRCRSSKGEKKISNYLSDNNINYVSHKTYTNLKGVGGLPLSYDFYIPQKNLLIEYQGQFHDGTATIQTKQGLENQIEHDKRKKEYAISNCIDLLEIWYWDYDNIEKILERKLC